jgi:hypothetical protein
MMLFVLFLINIRFLRILCYVNFGLVIGFCIIGYRIGVRFMSSGERACFKVIIFCLKNVLINCFGFEYVIFMIDTVLSKSDIEKFKIDIDYFILDIYLSMLDIA